MIRGQQIKRQVSLGCFCAVNSSEGRRPSEIRRQKAQWPCTHNEMVVVVQRFNIRWLAQSECPQSAILRKTRHSYQTLPERIPIATIAISKLFPENNFQKPLLYHCTSCLGPSRTGRHSITYTIEFCVILWLTGHLEPIDQALPPEDAWVHTSPGDRWGGSGKCPVAAVPVPPRHNSIRQRILRSRYRRTSNMIPNCCVSVIRWTGRDRR